MLRILHQFSPPHTHTHAHTPRVHTHDTHTCTHTHHNPQQSSFISSGLACLFIKIISVRNSFSHLWKRNPDVKVQVFPDDVETFDWIDVGTEYLRYDLRLTLLNWQRTFQKKKNWTQQFLRFWKFPQSNWYIVAKDAISPYCWFFFRFPHFFPKTKLSFNRHVHVGKLS